MSPKPRVEKGTAKKTRRRTNEEDWEGGDKPPSLCTAAEPTHDPNQGSLWGGP